MEDQQGQDGMAIEYDQNYVPPYAELVAPLMNDQQGHCHPSGSPYAQLKKAKVLHDAQILFNDPKAIRENPHKCAMVITQLLHLQNTGQYMSSVEATEVFFGVTKLFESNDAALRRMVYLFIKDVAEMCDPNDVIILTSSLTKDMTCDVDLYRANAWRVMILIIDATYLSCIEYYFKQAIVDSSCLVSSSALVSATHWFQSNPKCAAIIQRWISEIQQATTSSSNEMVQFHGMQLLYLIKSHDQLGNLVSQLLTSNTLWSPLALVLLVRYTTKLMNDEAAERRLKSDGSPVALHGYQFLEALLHHKSELVWYEAAWAICSSDGLEPQDLTPAILALELLLNSPKPTSQHAAKKMLAMVANIQPNVVVPLMKAKVLHDAWMFHDTNALLHLQNTGQCMSSLEATEVFFGVTKLFTSDDASLRRMVYLVIKDVAKKFDYNLLVMVQNCLLKDMTFDIDLCLTKYMTCGVGLFHANALRVLVHIMDTGMHHIPPHIKQHIVCNSVLVLASRLFQSSPECAAIIQRWISEIDKALSPSKEMLQLFRGKLLGEKKVFDGGFHLQFVITSYYNKQLIVAQLGQGSSSASASHLFQSNPECAAIIQRWISKIQEATTSSSNEMVQFHGMQLLYLIKSHDQLGNLVSQLLTSNTLWSPLALVLLVRYSAKLLNDEAAEGRLKSDGSPVALHGYQFLEALLHHKSELVRYEAAWAICSLDGLEPQDLTPAISALQLFLSSPKPTTRHAAKKTLAMVANTQLHAVAT